MKNLRTGPVRLGAAQAAFSSGEAGIHLAERRAVEQAAAAEIGHKCPECGSSAYYPDGGCYTCRSCGFSPCK